MPRYRRKIRRDYFRGRAAVEEGPTPAEAQRRLRAACQRYVRGEGPVMKLRDALVRDDPTTFTATVVPLLQLRTGLAGTSLRSTFTSNDGFHLYLGETLAQRQHIVWYGRETATRLPAGFADYGPELIADIFGQLATRGALAEARTRRSLPPLAADQATLVAQWAQRYTPPIARTLFRLSHAHDGRLWVPLSLFAPLEPVLLPGGPAA